MNVPFALGVDEAAAGECNYKFAACIIFLGEDARDGATGSIGLNEEGACEVRPLQYGFGRQGVFERFKSELVGIRPLPLAILVRELP